MNEIKLEIENKLDGSKTYRGKNSKFVNSPKQLNFPNSPRNKNINLLNLGNINTNQFSKYISKKGNSNSNNNIFLENKSKAYKQQSSNNIINNQINKKIKDQSKEKIFQKGALNEKLESFLFKNKFKSKKNNNINLLNPKPKIFNNVNDITTRLKLNNNEFKINLNSFMEYKQRKQSSKLKYNNKRSSSVINANKGNEKIKENNNLTYKDNLFTKNNKENEKINPAKTPIKKIIIESDKKNKNINDVNINNINSNGIKKLYNNKKIDIEENHFKAVLYNQEIKKLKNKLN